MSKYLLVAAALATLGACSQPVRFVADPPAEAAPVRLRLASLEVKDVLLPAYAIDPDILVEQPDGSLKALKKAVWADETAQGVTQGIASAIAARSTADVAAEPWPLAAYPDAQLVVRFDRFVPQAGGTFRASGQFALASPDRRIRESITNFDLSVPIAGDSPQAMAAARAQMLRAVAAEVIKKLS